MLNTQAEQINRIENNLDTINAEMKEADKALTGMEKWCGLFVCPWNKSEFQQLDHSFKILPVLNDEHNAMSSTTSFKNLPYIVLL